MEVAAAAPGKRGLAVHRLQLPLPPPHAAAEIQAACDYLVFTAGNEQRATRTIAPLCKITPGTLRFQRLYY